MGRRVPAEKVAVLLECLEAGMNPRQAAAAAGVSDTFAYELRRRARRRPAGPAAAAREAGRAARRETRLRAARERDRRLAGALAAGLNPHRAAAAVGVPKSTAYEFYGKIGRMRPEPEMPGGRSLSREERYEIARLREARPPLSVRQVAARIGRSPSTVSRELRRNACPRTGGYQPEAAHAMARRRRARPKASKLSRNPALRAAVQGMLNRRYSPEQASGRLKVEHPGDTSMHVSHETIYQSVYVYPRGELRRELKAGLRSGRDRRRPRGRRERRARIIGAVPVGQRPPEAEGRLVPGHHEGDLVMGSKASNSAVGTVVERMTGYLTLLHLPEGHTADAVADAVTARLAALPSWFAATLTWDNGTEMARHARITAETGVQVYFADPHAPWQRGSNENLNGLLREYLPKGTDLSVHDAARLQAIEDELNDRPRKRLGYHTPREALAKLLLEQESVATTP
jgi:IS30 family transposase